MHAVHYIPRNTLLRYMVLSAVVAGHLTLKMRLLQRSFEQCSFSNPDANYRISDAVKGGSVGLESTTLAHYPKSLLASFFLRKGPSSKDKVALLWDIIHNQFRDQFGKVEAALHIRLGDVLDEPLFAHFMQLQEVLVQGSFYCPPLKWYQALAKKLLAKGISQLHVFANAYSNQYTPGRRFLVSCSYLHAVGNILMRHGLKVTFEIGNTADHDFVVMSRSKYFIPTGGGFSKLIASLVLRNGGAVLRDSPELCHGLYGQGFYCMPDSPLDILVDVETTAERYPECITLSAYNVGPHAITQLQMIPSDAWKNISWIALNRAEIGDAGVVLISNALFGHHASSLSRLELEGNLISDAGIVALSQALDEGATSSLGWLKLGGNMIGSAGLNALVQAITQGALPSLNGLELEHNHINDAGVLDLSHALSKGALPSLRRLELNGNRIGNAGVEALSRAGIEGALSLLTELRLGSNYNINDTGVMSLSLALTMGALPRLRDLRLNGNRIDDPGMAVLSRALVAEGLRTSLIWLRLDSNSIGDAGMVAFATALADGALPELYGLELQGNRFGSAGVSALSRALLDGALPSLNWLRLDDNHIGDMGVEALSQVLNEGGLPSLSVLVLKGNRISNHGMMALARACKHMHTAGHGRSNVLDIFVHGTTATSHNILRPNQTVRCNFA